MALAAPSAPASGYAPARAADDPAPDLMIRVVNLGKRFKIYARPADRLLEWFTGNRVRRHTDYWAVRDVSLRVRRGECVGIIGANGSGKSTLLKMITGALYPTEGTAEVRARTLSLLDLGTGLHPLMTGRQNVINAARLLGFPSGYAQGAMTEIEAFADIGEFFDRPVGLYSAGMRVRLSFSIFACFKPEVFIVDEALAVGDVFFQQKCHARLRSMLDDGLTMLFVSHDQGAVLNLCDRAILMEKGRAVFEGEPAEALSRYTASLRGAARHQPRVHSAAAPPCGSSPPAPERPDAPSEANGTLADPATSVDEILAHDVIGARSTARFGTGAARILACRVTDHGGRDAMRAFMGAPLTFHLLVEAIQPIRMPRVAVHLVDRFTNLLFAGGTKMLGDGMPPLSPGERLTVRLEITMDVAPGVYSFSVTATEPAESDPDAGVVHDQIPDLGPIHIGLDRSRPRPFHGVARLPMRATHQVVPVSEAAVRGESGEAER